MKKTIAILFAALLPLAALAQTANQFYGRLHVWPNWTHSISSTVTHAVATETINKIVEQDHTSGTSNHQMNAFVWLVGTLTNGQENVVNLAASTNRFGEAIAFTNLCFLGVRSPTNNTANLKLGDLAAHVPIFGATNESATLRPGGAFVLTAPIAGTTNDTVGYVCASTFFRVSNPADPTNAAVSLSYELYIGGQK